jgi:hypothetical protein
MPPEAVASGADTVVAEFTDMAAEVTDMMTDMTAEMMASGATAPVLGLVRSGSAHSR